MAFLSFSWPPSPILLTNIWIALLVILQILHVVTNSSRLPTFRFWLFYTLYLFSPFSVYLFYPSYSNYQFYLFSSGILILSVLSLWLFLITIFTFLSEWLDLLDSLHKQCMVWWSYTYKALQCNCIAFLNKASFCHHQVRSIPFILNRTRMILENFPQNILTIPNFSFPVWVLRPFLFDNIMRPKKSKVWLRFGFNSPKGVGNHFRCKQCNSWEATATAEETLHCTTQRLLYLLTSAVIFPKMLSLKCQLKQLPEIYIILIFTHVY